MEAVELGTGRGFNSIGTGRDRKGQEGRGKGTVREREGDIKQKKDGELV